MNGALPAWAIDLIHDGVPDRELRARGDAAVVSALIRTAMSAQHRDWSFMEWEAVLRDPGRKLVTQLRRDKKQKPETPARVRKTLSYAWDKAWENRTSAPARDQTTTQREIRERHEHALSIADDPGSGLPDADRVILRHAANTALKRGMTRVALPWRAVAADTGLGERTTKNALHRLVTAGHLAIAQRGAASGPNAKKRRANVYEVAPNKSRGTRPVGPPKPEVGPPVRRQAGTATSPVGPKTVSQGQTASPPAHGELGFRLTRHPDGRLVIESAQASEGALLSLLTHLVSDNIHSSATRSLLQGQATAAPCR